MEEVAVVGLLFFYFFIWDGQQTCSGGHTTNVDEEKDVMRNWVV
jgi:hypothetical protein